MLALVQGPSEYPDAATVDCDRLKAPFWPDKSLLIRSRSSLALSHQERQPPSIG